MLFHNNANQNNQNIINRPQENVTPYQHNNHPLPGQPTFNDIQVQRQTIPKNNHFDNQAMDNKDQKMTNFQTVGGFGQQYFNVRDPNFNQQNTPVKMGRSLHIRVFVFNIIFLFCLIFGIIALNNLFGLWAFLPMVIFSYLFYICAACCCSDIKEYIDNMKKNDDYQQTYDKMVKGQAYFDFYIQCFHYVTTGSGKHRRTRKVVTHTARQKYTFRQSVDESGQITNIDEIKNFVFIHYLKRYYFTDDRSQELFKEAFNHFVASNRRDSHQSYSHTFHIQNFEEFTCYTALGDNCKSQALFYIFSFLGLALPYSCIFESAVARYDVGILKRLTV